MTVLLAISGGLAGAAVGAVAAAALAYLLGGAFGMSDFEGGRALFAAFVAGPVGAVIGLVGGIVAAARLGARGAPAGAAMRTSGLAVLGLGGLAAAALGLLHLRDGGLAIGGLPPRLEFELRVPASVAVPTTLDGFEIRLDTDSHSVAGVLGQNWAVRGPGYTVISGDFELGSRTASRVVVVRLPGEATRLYVLKLPASPAPTAEFGPWRKPDYVDTAGQGSPRAAARDDPFELRLRVVRP